VSERELVIPPPPPAGSCSKSPGNAGAFFRLTHPAFRPTRAAWSAPVSRRTDGADGRFSPGLTFKCADGWVFIGALGGAIYGADIPRA
jgi:hypothetical protein